MADDFPAAHSMDCTWFAVDKDGRVGWFETGEAGVLPGDAYTPEDPDEVIDALLGTARIEDEAYYEENDLRRLGFYVFNDGEDQIPGFYDRTGSPKRPMHLDELPPSLRDKLASFRFADASFARQKRLHLGDETECFGWDPLMVLSDGKTVVPLSGHEKEYKEFCSRLIEEDPDMAERYRFPGLGGDEDPPAGKGKKKRKK